MRSGPIIVALLLSVLAAFHAGAQEHELEDVQTPLTLPELLPKGGIDAVDVDFWMITEITRDGRRALNDRFMRWSAKAVDGKLRFVIETGRADADKPHSFAETIYTKDGRFVSYHQVSSEHGRKVEETRGEVVNGDTIVMKTTSYDEAGEPTKTQTTSRSMDFFKTTVPSEWFSLIAAYHIRKGSLGYRFARTDIHYRYQHAETKLKDIGTERVEVEGETYDAHLLKGTRTFGKPGRGSETELVYLMLPNGEMVYSKTNFIGMDFVSRRVGRDDVAERFWLPGEAQDDAGE